MDSKIQRYIQRIDQIIKINKPNASPHRKSPKIIKTNQLDKYLKY